jgi:hypothetical protein
MRCGLLNLGSIVAEAKYEGMLSKHEKKVNLSDQQRILEPLEQQRRFEAGRAAKAAKAARARKPALQQYTQPSLVDTGIRSAEAGNTTAFEESQFDEDIPFFLREFMNKFPFGNVHMALRIGPLIIENGAKRYDKNPIINLVTAR